MSPTQTIKSIAAFQGEDDKDDGKPRTHGIYFTLRSFRWSFQGTVNEKDTQTNIG